MATTLMIFAALPFAISFAACIAARKDGKYPKYIALAAALATLAIAVGVLLSPAAEYNVVWFSAGSVQFTINLASYAMNKLLLVLVAVMAPIIIIYSFGMVNTYSEQGRYYSLLSLFTAAMVLFSITNGMITLLISWALLGITSYLLIGFWYSKPGPAPAARKAITIITIGDLSMLGGVIMVWMGYHTFSFTQILPSGSSPYLAPAMLLLLIGAFTKCAQFPFNGWLPDAMEGPTPISAFLHSSTMVKAGVFLVAVLLPLIIKANLAALLVIVGGITALIGAVNAISETHIKKVLAYSTLEDIGLMFIALGFLGVPAAMLLFFVQTFYKSLLFLSAGSAMKANPGEESIKNIYGLRNNSLLFWSTAAASLSLIGIFPLSGFFGKAAVVSAASGSILGFVLLAVLQLLSSVYMLRWLYFLSRTPPKEARAKSAVDYRILPNSMIAAGIAVLVLLLAASFYPVYLSGFMGWKINIGLAASVIFAVIIAAGAGIVYAVYVHGRAQMRMPNWVPSISHPNAAVDKAYDLLSYAAMALAGLAAVGEIYISKLEGCIYGATAWLGRKIGFSENGQVGTYLFAVILGFAIISALLLLVFA
jgi:NADH-quinone oxidoreductase subunit L